MALVSLKNVEKVYKTRFEEVHALKGVDLDVNKGEIVVIMGPSGSGKSTLLHILAFLDDPTSGVRLVSGEDKTRVSDLEAARLRRDVFGFVFQEYNLIPEMTVEENIGLTLRVKGVSGAEYEDRVRRAAERVGIADKLGRKGWELSGGERQRVAIARAVASDSVVLVMDEPTGNLDEANEDRIVEIISDFVSHPDKAVVIATHSTRLRDKLLSLGKTRVVTLADGKVVR